MGLMIWFKRIIVLCLSPLTISLGLIILGLICLWSGRRPKLGRGLAVTGLVLLIMASYGQFSRNYLARMERQYDPLNLATQPTSTVSQIRFVVVLGSGHISDPRLPVNSQVSAGSLFRIVEGIRLHRHLPDSRLILTGGPGFDTVPNAEVVAAVAMEIGIPRDNLIILSRPRDTREEAVNVKVFAGTAPFALVTSAVHMPRAMKVFKAEGMNPLPAPTEFAFPAIQKPEPESFLPTVRGLGYSQQVLYEILASIQETIRDWK